MAIASNPRNGQAADKNNIATHDCRVANVANSPPRKLCAYFTYDFQAFNKDFYFVIRKHLQVRESEKSEISMNTILPDRKNLSEMRV